MWHAGRYSAWWLVLIAFTLLCPPGVRSQSASAPLAPSSGIFLGAQLQWDRQTPAGFARDTGIDAAVFGVGVGFPLNRDDEVNLTRNLTEISARGAMALVTVAPRVPLPEISAEMADEFATHLALVSTRLGVPVFLRFAPEMNGAWEPWGQQPTAYVAAFRVVADALHRRAPGAAMVWEPTSGSGYPFDGDYASSPRDADWSRLDTDGDGLVSEADDPYAPYYPGDDAVDWVGLRLAYWGNSYPYGTNQIPAPGLFSDQLFGTTVSGGVDFYATYSRTTGKPFLLDTAALYNTASSTGDDELSIKQAWWRQIIAEIEAGTLANLHLLLWSEERMPQPEVGGEVVDWSLGGTSEAAAAFKRDIASIDIARSHDSGSPLVARVTGRQSIRWVVGIAAVALFSVALLGLLFPRRLSWAYPRSGGNRDLRVDFLRGVAISFVVVDHLDAPSLYHLISQERIGAVSGAELFVFLSGGVLGMVYRRRIASLGWAESAPRIFQRAGVLYTTAVVVSLSAYALTFVPGVDASVLTTWTDRGANVVYQLYPGLDQPSAFAQSVLFLRSGPSQFNIMGLYVVLLLAAPLFLWLFASARSPHPKIDASPITWWLWERRAWGAPLLLGSSAALYVVSQIHPVRIFDAQFEDPFPLFSWQVLFVAGIAVGYYRDAVERWFRTVPGRGVILAAIVIAAAGAFFSWNNPYIESSWDVRLRLIPANDFVQVYGDWFKRAVLGPGRLLNVFAVLIAAYTVLTVTWRPLNRAFGWFFVPLGAATLYVFVLQVVFSLLFANVGAFHRENVLLNTAGHTVVLLACWLMVKYRVLFRIIPQ